MQVSSRLPSPASQRSKRRRVEASSEIPNAAEKREQEKLARQKARELEKAQRDKAKEEERRLKQEERERKELERKAKRELAEKQKEERREAERLKKEEKRLRLEEEKRKKELERLLKEEERKQREDEKKKKEEEKRQREEERRQKEEEKRLKEEEKKQREERSQMKISSFFSFTNTAPKPSPVRAKSSSPVRDSPADDTKEAKKAASAVESTYEADFLPFFVKKNVVMAPAALLSPEALEKSTAEFDAGLLQEPSGALDLKKPLETAVTTTVTTQALVEALNSSHVSEDTLQQLASGLGPIRYLQFYENSKPPYVGTWALQKHTETLLSARIPLETTTTGLDYTYDSDLDWQDGDEGEGEDIEDLEDGDDEEDEGEDEDMDDFVDDNDTGRKRAQIGPLQSVSIWNDGKESGPFAEMRYEILSYDISFPIDPYHNHCEPNKDTVKSLPAAPSSTPQALVTSLGTQVVNVLTPRKPVIQDAKVVKELMKFIRDNSDYSIGTLSELAKKEFKVYTKSILKHTIQEVAIYNKKKSSWEIKADSAVV